MPTLPFLWLDNKPKGQQFIEKERKSRIYENSG